jgi:hypothetical protein
MNYLFPELMKKRQKDTENIGKRILIITDNHKSRLNRQLMEYSSKNNIDFLTIPPHTSHIIQPLDRGVNGTFKSAFTDSFKIPKEETQSALREAIVEASITVLLNK